MIILMKGTPTNAPLILGTPPPFVPVRVSKDLLDSPGLSDLLQPANPKGRRSQIMGFKTQVLQCEWFLGCKILGV